MTDPGTEFADRVALIEEQLDKLTTASEGLVESAENLLAMINATQRRLDEVESSHESLDAWVSSFHPHPAKVCRSCHKKSYGIQNRCGHCGKGFPGAD